MRAFRLQFVFPAGLLCLLHRSVLYTHAYSSRHHRAKDAETSAACYELSTDDMVSTSRWVNKSYLFGGVPSYFLNYFLNTSRYFVYEQREIL